MATIRTTKRKRYSNGGRLDMRNGGRVGFGPGGQARDPAKKTNYTPEELAAEQLKRSP